MPLTSEMPVYRVPPLSSFGIATQKTLPSGAEIGYDEYILKPDSSQVIEKEFQKVSDLKSMGAGKVELDRSSPSTRAMSYFRQALRGMATGHLDTMKSLKLNPNAKKEAIRYAELGEYASSKFVNKLSKMELNHITEKDFSLALVMLKAFNQISYKMEKEMASGSLKMQDVKRDWDEWSGVAEDLAKRLNTSMDEQPILMAATQARTRRAQAPKQRSDPHYQVPNQPYKVPNPQPTTKGSPGGEYANLAAAKESGEYQNVARATAKLPNPTNRPEADLPPDYEKLSVVGEYANLAAAKEPGEYQNVARATAKLPKSTKHPAPDLPPNPEELNAVAADNPDESIYASVSDVLPGYEEMQPSASAPNPDEPAYTPMSDAASGYTEMHDADSSAPPPPSRGASRKPAAKKSIGTGWKDPSDALPAPKTKAPPLPPARTTPGKGEYAPVGDVDHLRGGKKKPPIYTGVGRQYMAANATLAEPKADGLVDEAKFPATEPTEEPKAPKKKAKAEKAGGIKKPDISTPLGRDPTFEVVRTTADIPNLPKSDPSTDKKDIKSPITDNPPKKP